MMRKKAYVVCAGMRVVGTVLNNVVTRTWKSGNTTVDSFQRLFKASRGGSGPGGVALSPFSRPTRRDMFCLAAASRIVMRENSLSSEVEFSSQSWLLGNQGIAFSSLPVGRRISRVWHRLHYQNLG